MAVTMDSRPPAPLIAISGAAGTGKTTLAHAWSDVTGARVIDLDPETVAIVAAELRAHPELDEPAAMARTRDRRYARLVEMTASARRSGARAVVTVAPFTLEIATAPAWADFVHRCGGGDVTLVWLSLSPAVRARRIAARAAYRDRDRLDLEARFDPPAVNHVAVDATASTQAQVALLRSHFDNRSGI